MPAAADWNHLVPKLPLGHALVCEALLRRRGSTGRAPSAAAPWKQSFQDKDVTKLELGHKSEKAPILHGILDTVVPFPERVKFSILKLPPLSSGSLIDLGSC